MPRVGVLIRNAHVASMDEARSEFAPGYVAIRDDVIVGVGPLRECPSEADHVIDAAGKVVLPGFVNAHTHAIHILMRGGLSDDRPLYDWLFNVILPGLAVYGQADVELAARFYCTEALLSGITTFVDNVEFPVDRFDMAADAAIGVYRDMGLRVIYARMFYDYTPPDFVPLIEAAQAREPGVRHDPGGFETAESALASIDSLIRRHHGSAGGRIQVWPSPGVAVLCSREGLLGAKDLARCRGTRLTLHLAESPQDRYQSGTTSISYLASIGFLGPEVLAGHCVQADSGDIATLKAFDVKVANNAVSNMFLGSGIAPVAEMQAAGVTVGLGTDDANCNNSVNMISDMKIAALAQKCRYGRAAAITAERVLATARGHWAWPTRSARWRSGRRQISCCWTSPGRICTRGTASPRRSSTRRTGARWIPSSSTAGCSCAAASWPAWGPTAPLSSRRRPSRLLPGSLSRHALQTTQAAAGGRAPASRRQAVTIS